MRASLLSVSLVLVACGGSSPDPSGGGSGTQGNDPQTTASAGSAFASQFCAHANECNVVIDDCQAAYTAVVLSSSCQQSMLGASCTDLAATPIAADLQSCFPTCTGTQACSAAGLTETTCNGDGTLTACVDGMQVTYGCDGVCALQSRTYTGTCGPSANGQTSTDGCSSCWCQ